MKKPLFFLAFSLIVVMSMFSQILWQNVEYGMSVETVKSLYPKAITPRDFGAVEYDEMYPLLCLENIEIAGNTFDVIFLFASKDNKLCQVNLFCTSKLSVQQGKRLYNELVEVLTVRYGNPLGGDKKILSGSYFWDTTWFSKGTNIILDYYAREKDNDSTRVAIIYQTRLLQESNKL